MSSKKTNLTNEEREAILCQLQDLSEKNGGALPRGSFGKVAKKFSVDRTTTRRIWDLAASRQNDVRRADRKRGTSFDRFEIRQKLLAVPPDKRRSTRQMAALLNIGKTSVGRLKKMGYLDLGNDGLPPPELTLDRVRLAVRKNKNVSKDAEKKGEGTKEEFATSSTK